MAADKLVLNDVKINLEELTDEGEKAAYIAELLATKNLPANIRAFLDPASKSSKQIRGEANPKITDNFPQFGGVTGHDVLGIPRPFEHSPEPGDGGVTGHDLKK